MLMKCNSKHPSPQLYLYLYHTITLDGEPNLSMDFIQASLPEPFQNCIRHRRPSPYKYERKRSRKQIVVDDWQRSLRNSGSRSFHRPGAVEGVAHLETFRCVLTGRLAH